MAISRLSSTATRKTSSTSEKPRVGTNNFGFADFIKAEKTRGLTGQLWSAESTANHNEAFDTLDGSVKALFPLASKNKASTPRLTRRSLAVWASSRK